MPHIQVYIGRANIGTCSGNVFSYEPIEELKGDIDGTPCQISPNGQITIQTPPGFDLETVSDASPYGDQGEERMVFDPYETARGTSGRVYMRAARLVERMRSGYQFIQVPSVGP